MSGTKSLAGLVAVLGAALAQWAAPAQAWETRFPGNAPVEITVLTPAGSSADLTARVFAGALARQLGAAVLVANRPGAGGALGYRHVAAQKPDGHSLVWMSGSIFTAHHMGLLALDYGAFEPLARVLVESLLVAVRSGSPWRTLEELIADAASRPGDITVGHAGRGSEMHLSSLALFRSAGVEVMDVPFPLSQVVALLRGGHVDAVVEPPAALSGPARTGSVRLLASLAPRRDPAMLDIPTAQEQGYKVSVSAWRGVAAPKRTPVGVTAALEAAIRSSVQDPAFGRALARLGVQPAFMSSLEFAALIEREHGELARLVERVGLAGQLR